MPFDLSRIHVPLSAMKRALVSGLLIVALAVGLSAAPRQLEGPVWFWFSTCGGPAMTLEVTLDGATILKTTFPICRAERSSAASQGQRGRIDFAFSATRDTVWKGYREESVRAAAGELIEGNVWQAGADPSALTLGVSFTDTKQILMNSVHTARPGQRDESSPASGLVIRTYPADSAASKTKR
jgi:hypothetical protein